MKILVPVKRVIDSNVRVQIDASGTAARHDGIKHALNPFDETAVEAAVQLKEAGKADEIVAVTIGPDAAQETLRTALAMGADRALHIVTAQPAEPLAVAKILEKLCAEENPDLVLCGRQAIDDDSGQCGPMLAARLGWAQAVGASDIQLSGRDITVTCEVDTGTVTLTTTLPAVVSADLRLNQPRFVTLPGLMKAKRKPQAKRAAEDFGVDLRPHMTCLTLKEPPPRSAGKKYDTVAEFADAILAEIQK